MRHNLRAFLGRYTDSPDERELFKLAEKLPPARPDGPWIAGGAVRRTLMDSPLDSDIDYFFRDAVQQEDFHASVQALKGWEIRRNQHNVTYGIRVDGKQVVIQAITMAYYASAEAVIDSFDFTITQFAYDGADLICGEFSLWDLARKRLALHKLTYGTSTVRRLIKYTRQGFTACSGVLADILESTVRDPATVHRETEYVD